MNKDPDADVPIVQVEGSLEFTFPSNHDRWVPAIIAVLPCGVVLTIAYAIIREVATRGLELKAVLATLFCLAVGTWMTVVLLRCAWTQTRFAVQPYGIVARRKSLFAKPVLQTWKWTEVRDLEIESRAGFPAGRSELLVIRLADGSRHPMVIGHSKGEARAVKIQIESVRQVSDAA